MPATTTKQQLVKLTADIPELGLQKGDTIDVQLGLVGRWLKREEVYQVLNTFPARWRSVEQPRT